MNTILQFAVLYIVCRQEPIEYNFLYSLTGDPEFSHEESRQEETVVGAYHVRLPDGRVQLVRYQADHTGYKPTVTYYWAPGNLINFNIAEN